MHKWLCRCMNIQCTYTVQCTSVHTFSSFSISSFINRNVYDIISLCAWSTFSFAIFSSSSASLFLLSASNDAVNALFKLSCNSCSRIQYQLQSKKSFRSFPCVVYYSTEHTTLYCHTSDTVIKCVSMQKLRQRLCYVSRKYDHTTAEVPSIMLWHCLIRKTTYSSSTQLYSTVRVF